MRLHSLFSVVYKHALNQYLRHSETKQNVKTVLSMDSLCILTDFNCNRSVAQILLKLAQSKDQDQDQSNDQDCYS